MARKSLFHVERFDSLHRHQVSDRYIKQQDSDAALRQIRLDSTESDPAKATGGQHQSVLTERPTDHRPIPPETVPLLWASFAFAALIFGAMGVVHFLGKECKPVPRPANDSQEWAHYPQPKD